MKIKYVIFDTGNTVHKSNAIDWSEFKKWFDDLMKADEQQAAATENVAE